MHRIYAIALVLQRIRENTRGGSSILKMLICHPERAHRHLDRRCGVERSHGYEISRLADSLEMTNA